MGMECYGAKGQVGLILVVAGSLQEMVPAYSRLRSTHEQQQKSLLRGNLKRLATVSLWGDLLRRINDTFGFCFSLDFLANLHGFLKVFVGFFQITLVVLVPASGMLFHQRVQ